MAKDSKRFTLSKTRQNIAIGLLVVIVALLGFAAFRPSAPAVTPEMMAEANAASAELEAKRKAQADAEAKPVALFIGDSYTAGARATDATKKWSTLVARELGWKESNLGVFGTGYVTVPQECNGKPCSSYLDRIEASKATPDVVILAGGQNDFPAYVASSTAVKTAIARTVDAAAQKWPEARLIVVGPSTPFEIDATSRGMDAAVQDAAKSVDAEYVSMIEPNVLKKSMVVSDLIHVSDDGYEAIADRVNSALQ